MNRCIRCVIPDTRPDTHFIDGVCSACLAYEQRPQIDWAERKEQLLKLLAAHRNPSGYDCIVPSSGGKDSTYQVLTLIELGARPLVVTASTCHLTDTGRKNIDNLARYATTIEVTYNRSVRAKLNRIGLEMVGDISWPEHATIFTAPFKVALNTGINLLFYGENPQNCYGGPPGSQDEREMTARWVSEFGGFLGLRPSDLVGQEGITERDMNDYRITGRGNVQAYFLGQFLPWDSHHNAAVALRAGMKWQLPSDANWWPWENQDNAQTGLHDHMMFRKYGYGRGAAQISVDIRTGRITREEGLDWVSKHDGLFPNTYMGVPVETVLDRIGMSRDELNRIMDRFTNRDIFPKGVTA